MKVEAGANPGRFWAGLAISPQSEDLADLCLDCAGGRAVAACPVALMLQRGVAGEGVAGVRLPPQVGEPFPSGLPAAETAGRIAKRECPRPLRTGPVAGPALSFLALVRSSAPQAALEREGSVWHLMRRGRVKADKQRQRGWTPSLWRQRVKSAHPTCLPAHGHPHALSEYPQEPHFIAGVPIEVMGIPCRSSRRPSWAYTARN